MTTSDIIEIDHVSKRFTKELDAAERIARMLGSSIQPQTVHAVDDVSFGVRRGEVMGLVGEFGVRQVHTRPHGRGTVEAFGWTHPLPRP